MTRTENFLYSSLADEIQRQIENGLLRTGDKLVSVREMSRQRGVSLSTAFQTYAELEMRGFIEARPRSGYYVRRLLAPKTIKRDAHTYSWSRRSVDDLISMVYNSRNSESLLSLSKASPSVDLIPIARLNKAMQEALRMDPSGCTLYEDVQGNLFLRQQLARLSFHWGGQINEHDIVTTNGCMEALMMSLHAVTRPGDTVVIDSPTYFGIFQAMQSLGLHVIEAPCDPETGVDLDVLEQILDREPVKACLFVLNFNNPLGSLMPETNKKRLVEMVSRRQIPLIEDDIYGELYFGKQRPVNCKTFDREGWVITCGSISKALSPGYRVGWCIPGRFKEKVMRSKLMQTVASCSPSHSAIAHFFAHGRYELHLRTIRKALYTRCLLYSDAIMRFFPQGTSITRPQGGYILWIALPEEVDAYQLYVQALEKGISISPGHIYSTDGRFTHHIRISYGRAFDKEVENGLAAIGSLCKSFLKN